ncbi:MAG TPA: hypothetical protein VK826_05970 [Bacteroidia bacterium]|nr:hypothetical protein [Bacteroidia bacterium]
MANPKPSNCTVFINIWVDVEALQANQSTGCYIVDNQCGANPPSQNEGSSSLVTSVPQGATICWTILPIDPQFANTLTITNMQQGSTGFAQVPSAYSSTAPQIAGQTWTGQLVSNSTGGNYSQTINCNATTWNGGTSFTVTPQIYIY